MAQETEPDSKPLLYVPFAEEHVIKGRRVTVFGSELAKSPTPRKFNQASVEETKPSKFSLRQPKSLIIGGSIAAAAAVAFSQLPPEISAQGVPTPTPEAKKPRGKAETAESRQLRQEINELNQQLKSLPAGTERVEKAKQRQQKLVKLLNEGRDISNHLIPDSENLAKNDPELARHLESVLPAVEGQLTVQHIDRHGGQTEDIATLATTDKKYRFHNQTRNTQLKPGQRVKLQQVASIGDHLVAADEINTTATQVSGPIPPGVSPMPTSENIQVLYYTAPGKTISSSDRQEIASYLNQSPTSLQAFADKWLFGRFLSLTHQMFPTTGAYTLDASLCHYLNLYDDGVTKMQAAGVDLTDKALAFVIDDETVCPNAGFPQGAYAIWGKPKRATVYQGRPYWTDGVMKHEIFGHSRFLLHHASEWSLPPGWTNLNQGTHREYHEYDGIVGNQWWQESIWNSLQRLNMGFLNQDQIRLINSSGEYEIFCNPNDPRVQLLQIARRDPTILPELGQYLWLSCMYQTGFDFDQRPIGHRGLNIHFGSTGDFQYTHQIDLSPNDGNYDVLEAIGTKYNFRNDLNFSWIMEVSQLSDRIIVRVGSTEAELEPTPTQTRTPTPGVTSTQTRTPTPALWTPTPTPTIWVPSPTPTLVIPTPTPTVKLLTPTPTLTPTVRVEPSATATARAESTATFTAEPTVIVPTATATTPKEITVTPIPTRSATPIWTPTPPKGFTPTTISGHIIYLPTTFDFTRG